MFNKGIRELLVALPTFSGLDEAQILRMLSAAWLEVVEPAGLDAPEAENAPTPGELRRMATALEVHVVLEHDMARPVLRACAFVAAEALEIARELEGVDVENVDSQQIQIGLLYLIAGYDANAAVAAEAVPIEPDRPPATRFALESLAGIVTGKSAMPIGDAALPDGLLFERIDHALLVRIGELASEFNSWLREPGVADTTVAADLLALADGLRVQDGHLPFAAHVDIQHLARVGAIAMGQAAQRATRNIPAPPDNRESFARFLETRCATQPLLWPAAADYVERVLKGDRDASAVVAVPTGAGKSAVADLAIQNAIGRGWVLYLAPTNALVGQIRRQLRADHPGLDVREFLGGAEYTAMPGEALDDIGSNEVLVMTPEKCSLALRQSPDAFEDLALLIFDEAHTLGDQRGRGSLSELVLAEVFGRAGELSTLFMSALIQNPEELAKWLEAALGRQAEVIREPWRPTRTLRAVVGIDRVALDASADGPIAELEGLSGNRVNVPIEVPLAVLAGLQGPWQTKEAADYLLKPTGARVSGQVFRDGEEPRLRRLTVRSTVESLAQLLGNRGQKVLAFQSRSRHDSFLAALSIEGFGVTELDPTVESLLALASAELGIPTLLAEALHRGAGVHTSALLAEERRASEIAFVDGDVAVLFATGTLAQGLNLPATAVIVGGTKIGYSPDQSAEERLGEERKLLLNAIGRAGRARVAIRSIALVVPNRLPVLDNETVVEGVLPRAEFLAEEDASTAMTSALRPLLSRIDSGAFDRDGPYPGDQVVVSYLGAGTDPDESAGLLRRSWGAFQLSLQDRSPSLVETILGTSEAMMNEVGAPQWTAEAARRAGIALPVAARFSVHIQDRLEGSQAAPLLGDWLGLLVDAVADLTPDELDFVLSREAVGSTQLRELWSENAADRAIAREALLETLSQWLAGSSISEVGGAAHGEAPLTDPRRGERNPIPRTIRLVNDGFGFGLTRAAGLIAAIVDVAIENEALHALSADSEEAMQRLPVAVRFGLSTRRSLALYRAGARPRRVAVTLDAVLPPTEDDLNEDAIRDWAREAVASLEDSVDALALDDAQRELIDHFLVSRDSR